MRRDLWSREDLAGLLAAFERPVTRDPGWNRDERQGYLDAIYDLRVALGIEPPEKHTVIVEVRRG